MKKIGIVMGSDSDLPVVKGALDELDKFGIPYEVHVMSAHRTPALAAEFAGNAKKNGFGVILSAAGKAAHQIQQSYARPRCSPHIGRLCKRRGKR